MASVDSCHADLRLATVPCSDEVLTQLQQVNVATLFQVLHRLGFQHTYLTGVSPRTSVQRFVGRALSLRRSRHKRRKPAWSRNCVIPSRAPRSLPARA
jgi:hypothetical protein